MSVKRVESGIYFLVEVVKVAGHDGDVVYNPQLLPMTIALRPTKSL